MKSFGIAKNKRRMWDKLNIYVRKKEREENWPEI